MGEEFDPCECIWGHERAMRRLLSMLRQSQSHCTDTECFIDVRPQENPSSDYYIVMSIVLGIYLFMQLWFMQNQRNRIPEPNKPSIEGNGSNGAPPTPPPTSS